jgi:hypothetical protein
MVRVLPALAPASSEWAQLELAGEEGGEYPALALGIGVCSWLSRNQRLFNIRQRVARQVFSDLSKKDGGQRLVVMLAHFT